MEEVKAKNKRKNPIFEREIRHNVRSQKYPDKDNPDTPKKVGNPPFYQLYKHSFKYLRKMMIENAPAVSLWWELVGFMDNQGAVMISQKALATHMSVSKRTIINRLNWLEEKELIAVFKVGTANVYALNGDVISDQRVTKKQHFALFNARVVLDKDEQNIETKRKYFSIVDSHNPNQLDLEDAIREAENERE